MTNEEAVKWLKTEASCIIETVGNGKEILEAYGMAIKALEQQPSDDCISREAVDEYITNLLSGYLYDEERTRLEDLSAFVWELPSATPQQKIGTWIEKEDYNFDTYYDCSECGESFCLIDGTPTDNLYKYCPNCGARMEAESEE